MLAGFGGKILRGNFVEPGDFYWHASLPSTKERNISLPKQIMTSDLFEVNIRKITREFADNIANAYNLPDTMCYNLDGTLNANLLKQLP